MNAFVTDLLDQMTLYSSDWNITGPTIKSDYEEKLKEGKVGAIFNAFSAKFTRELQSIAVKETRLGIRLLFAYDVIHGHRTIFPIPLGESASWDLNAIERSAKIAAAEASAKQFVAYGKAQAGRDYHSTDMSEYLAAAQDVARKLMVLLNNEKQLLPLSKEGLSIAVIGPLADSKEDMKGGWSAAGDRKEKPISVLTGILAKVLDRSNVYYAKGANYEFGNHDNSDFANAIEIAKKSADPSC